MIHPVLCLIHLVGGHDNPKLQSESSRVLLDFKTPNLVEKIPMILEIPSTSTRNDAKTQTQRKLRQRSNVQCTPLDPPVLYKSRIKKRRMKITTPSSLALPALLGSTSSPLLATHQSCQLGSSILSGSSS